MFQIKKYAFYILHCGVTPQKITDDKDDDDDERNLSFLIINYIAVTIFTVLQHKHCTSPQIRRSTRPCARYKLLYCTKDPISRLSRVFDCTVLYCKVTK